MLFQQVYYLSLFCQHLDYFTKFAITLLDITLAIFALFPVQERIAWLNIVHLKFPYAAWRTRKKFTVINSKKMM